METARDTAELALRAALREDKGRPVAHAEEFISTVYRAFAHQACEAHRQGLWSAAEARENVQGFLLWSLVPHAYELADLRRVYNRNAPWSLRDFRDHVSERITSWDVYDEYLQERLTVAAELNARALSADGHHEDRAEDEIETPLPASTNVERMPEIDDVTLAKEKPAGLPTHPAPEQERQAVALSEPQGGADSSALVEAFRTKVSEATGKKPSFADIWRVAGYVDKGAFSLFRRGKGSLLARRKFRAVLAMPPEVFMTNAERERKRARKRQDT